MKNDKNKIKNLSKEEIGEDSTQYGEFIPSYFEWVSSQKQKEIVDRLQNITNENEKKSEN